MSDAITTEPVSEPADPRDRRPRMTDVTADERRRPGAGGRVPRRHPAAVAAPGRQGARRRRRRPPNGELATITGDGIEIEPLYVADGGRPAAGYPGQPPFVRGRAAGRQPRRVGRAAASRAPRPGGGPRADPGGPRGRRHLALARPRRRPDPGRRPARRARGDLPRPGPDRPRRGRAVRRGGAGVPRRRRGPGGAGRRAGRLPGRRPARAAGAGTGAEPTLRRDRGRLAAADLARRCAADFPGVRAIVVDALPYHDAGGSDARGARLLAGRGRRRTCGRCAAAGLSAEAAFGQLEFRYAATADQFPTIAKLRAARRLWARVAQRAASPPTPRGSGSTRSPPGR